MHKTEKRTSAGHPGRETVQRWRRRHRLVGTVLVLVGAASALVGLSPALAAETLGGAAESSVANATLEWAVSPYVATSGSLTPDRDAVAPATDDGASWTFPTLRSGVHDASSGATELAFEGGLAFGNTARGNYGFRFTDLVIEVDESGAGRLVADVATRGPVVGTWGTPVPAVTVVDFTLSADDIVEDGPSITWTVTPDYPLQADGETFADPAYEGARQFPDSYLSAIDPGFHAHFSDTLSGGAPNANNPTKPPAPITVQFTFEPDSASTTTSTPSSTVTSTAPTTSTTAAAPTTSTTTPSGETPEAHGSETAAGSAGQTLTVAPVHDLDPAGATVSVTGDGYDPDGGIYLAFCVDNGPAAAPSPCVGGADQSGESGSSRWITNHPPAPGISTPFGPGGDFSTTLHLVADDGTVDCLDDGVQCVVATRADHTRANDRSADVKVPVYFAGQTAPGTGGERDPNRPGRPDGNPQDAERTVTVSPTTVTAGEPVTITGAGLLPGEQVQVILHSDPIVLAVVLADDDGAVATSAVIPANTPPGAHHIELRGVTSGISVDSPPFTVTAPDRGAAAVQSKLARTGGSPFGLIAGGSLLVVIGISLVLAATSRRDLASQT